VVGGLKQDPQQRRRGCLVEDGWLFSLHDDTRFAASPNLEVLLRPIHPSTVDPDPVSGMPFQCRPRTDTSVGSYLEDGVESSVAGADHCSAAAGAGAADRATDTQITLE
jgi:hypothetical protein